MNELVLLIQGVHIMMLQCCASVCDAGPTLKQHWVSAVWLFLGGESGDFLVAHGGQQGQGGCE